LFIKIAEAVGLKFPCLNHSVADGLAILGLGEAVEFPWVEVFDLDYQIDAVVYRAAYAVLVF
jgi:hypothetical protein